MSFNKQYSQHDNIIARLKVGYGRMQMKTEIKPRLVVFLVDACRGC
jgi:hypothetical protein